MDKNACVVWSPIVTPEKGLRKLPGLIADAINGPVLTQRCHPSVASDGYKHIQFKEFGRDSIFDKVTKMTPFRSLFTLIEYAAWKPPSRFDAFITRGPKAIHTTQRLGQHHMHYLEGTYRGPFLQLNKYESFQDRSAHEQFFFGLWRLFLRNSIQSSMNTVDTLVVNSEYVADIARSMFNREPDNVIYPFVDLESYSPDWKNDCESNHYYLYLGKIDELHRTQEAIKAFNELPYNLKVVGDGRMMSKLKSKASDSITFCGYTTGNKKRRLLSNAKGLINPTDHSFGRVLIESLASGTPVISINDAYPPYIIEDGITGMLYEAGVSNLIQTVKRFEASGVEASEEQLVKKTDPYSKERIQKRWQSIL